jgi:arabinose-5-phosphate isomerase
MSLAARQPVISLPVEPFRLAREVIETEARALQRLASCLPAGFSEAVDMICQCEGSVMISGIGKAGWIAQKISATMASTGTRSHYLHPSEAMHGDLGRIGPRDIVMVFSNSGETSEVLQLLPTLQKRDVPLIAIVGAENSSLGKAATITLGYGNLAEACPLGLAPTTSTAVMLALGDALALVASQHKGFRHMDFAVFHPGGSLGKKLSRVNEIMRPLADCRVGNENRTVRETLVALQNEGRRSGAVLLLNDAGELTGIFTDSDLARILERGQDHLLDEPVGNVMSARPKTVASGTQTMVAVEILACHNISELPVVDSRGCPLGIIDITDVISLLPRKADLA